MTNCLKLPHKHYRFDLKTSALKILFLYFQQDLKFGSHHLKAIRPKIIIWVLPSKIVGS